jgi:hypothetical protein
LHVLSHKTELDNVTPEVKIAVVRYTNLELRNNRINIKKDYKNSKLVKLTIRKVLDIVHIKEVGSRVKKVGQVKTRVFSNRCVVMRERRKEKKILEYFNLKTNAVWLFLQVNSYLMMAKYGHQLSV